MFVVSNLIVNFAVGEGLGFYDMLQVPFEIKKFDCKYPYTFLQSVLFGIMYNSENESYESFSDFLNGAFGISVDRIKYNNAALDPIRIVSDDKSTRLMLSPGDILIHVKGTGYSTFSQSLKPLVEIINFYASHIEATCSSVMLKKVNMWPVLSNYDFDVSTFVKSIVSPNLLYEDKNISTPIKGGQTYTDDIDNLTLDYEFIHKNKDNTQPARLVLNSSCFLSKEILCGEELIEKIDYYNTILDSAYHWAVTEQVIEAMKGTR